MQIQAINNSTSEANFKSRRSDAIDEATAFVNMNDAQLRVYAELASRNPKQDKKDAKSINKIFWAMPVIDTLASALLVAKTSRVDADGVKRLIKNPLSIRAKGAALQAADWGLIIGAVGVFNLLKKGFNKKSEKAEHFEKRRPVASFVMDVMGIFAGLIGVGYLANKAINKNPEKYNKIMDTIDDKFLKLDDTKFAQKQFPKIQKFMTDMVEKTPKLAKAGRFALANSVWILLGLGLAKMLSQSNKQNDRIQKNYEILKQKQLEVAKYITNEARCERDMAVEGLKRNYVERSKPSPRVEIEDVDFIEEFDD